MSSTVDQGSIPSGPSVVSRLRRHLRNPWALPGIIWKNVTHPFSPHAAEARFDRALGLDTSGWIDPDRLDLDEARAALSNGYEGTPVRTAEHLIGKVLDHARGFTFV